MLHLQVVTPRGEVLSSDVDEVYIPGVLGEFGVLVGHVPFLSAVRPGIVRYRGAGKSGRLAVGSGLAEVGAGDHVVVLVEQARTEAGDQDALRAELAELKRRAASAAGPASSPSATDAISSGPISTETVSAETVSIGGEIALSEQQRLQDQIAWIEAQLELA